MRNKKHDLIVVIIGIGVFVILCYPWYADCMKDHRKP